MRKRTAAPRRRLIRMTAKNLRLPLGREAVEGGVKEVHLGIEETDHDFTALQKGE